MILNQDILQTRFDFMAAMLEEEPLLRQMVAQYLYGRSSKKNRLTFRYHHGKYIVNRLPEEEDFALEWFMQLVWEKQV